MEEVLTENKVYHIPKISEKRKAENEASKGSGDSELDLKEKWFAEIRKKLTGFCQCGCGEKSQKNDDKFFRASCCHLFPKRIFKSIQYHRDNYVERAFWGGCHSQMDDRSMEKWVCFEDWEVIRDKFNRLEPFLTMEEKATKFYSILERLVQNYKVAPQSNANEAN